MLKPILPKEDAGEFFSGLSSVHNRFGGNFFSLSVASVERQPNDLQAQLFEAVQNNNVPLALELIERGADVNHASAYEAPLAYVAKSCEMVEVLRNAKADFSAQQRDYSPIHYEDDPALVECLLQAGAPIDARDKEGATALMHAVTMEDVRVVEILLKHNASVNTLDYQRNTALIRAVLNHSEQMVATLLSSGADPNLGDDPPIGTAAFSGDLDIVKNLMRYGADSCVPTGPFSQSAQAAAALAGHCEISILIARDSRNPGCAPDPRETTALHSAADNDLVCINGLVEAGIPVDVRNVARRTPLHIAATKGHMRACETLIALGADRNAVDARGDTPADFARRNGHNLVADFLTDR